MEDANNPRYFFVSRSWATTGESAHRSEPAVRFGVRREKTKVRVNGVVAATVVRLEYWSAPGGAPRHIPLLQIAAGDREFCFRSANLAHGRLAAYDVDGKVLAQFSEEPDP